MTKSTIPGKDFDQNLVDKNLRTQAWEARKAKIAEKDKLSDKDSIRLSGGIKLLRSFTWGPVVNVFNGIGHTLLGVGSMIYGLGAEVVGNIIDDQDLKNNGREFLTTGFHSLVAGIAATSIISGVVSDVYDGVHRILYGKRVENTLESYMSVNARTRIVAAVGQEQFIKDIEWRAASEKNYENSRKEHMKPLKTWIIYFKKIVT